MDAFSVADAAGFIDGTLRRSLLGTVAEFDEMFDVVAADAVDDEGVEDAVFEGSE